MGTRTYSRRRADGTRVLTAAGRARAGGGEAPAVPTETPKPARQVSERTRKRKEKIERERAFLERVNAEARARAEAARQSAPVAPPAPPVQPTPPVQPAVPPRTQGTATTDEQFARQFTRRSTDEKIVELANSSSLLDDFLQNKVFADSSVLTNNIRNAIIGIFQDYYRDPASWWEDILMYSGPTHDPALRDLDTTDRFDIMSRKERTAIRRYENLADAAQRWIDANPEYRPPQE